MTRENEPVGIFDDFAAKLPEQERDVLYASVPLLIAVVVGADGTFDPLEIRKAADALIASVEELGHEFRHSEAAEQSFDRVATRANNGVPGLKDRLQDLAAVVDKMPLPLKQT